MKFKFKRYIGKSASFPLPPLLLRLFDYVDCWNIMAINSIIIIVMLMWRSEYLNVNLITT